MWRANSHYIISLPLLFLVLATGKVDAFLVDAESILLGMDG